MVGGIGILWIDDKLRWKFRGVVKAIGEVVGFNTERIAKTLSKLKGRDRTIDLLIGFTHADRFDSVMWDELSTLVFEAKNQYAKYDRESYEKTKQLLKELIMG